MRSYNWDSKIPLQRTGYTTGQKNLRFLLVLSPAQGNPGQFWPAFADISDAGLAAREKRTGEKKTFSPVRLNAFRPF